MGRVAIIGAGIFVTAFTVNLAWDVVLAREKYLSDNGVSSRIYGGYLSHTSVISVGI